MLEFVYCEGARRHSITCMDCGKYVVSCGCGEGGIPWCTCGPSNPDLIGHGQLTKDQFELAFRRHQDKVGCSYDPWDIAASYDSYRKDPWNHWISLTEEARELHERETSGN